MQFTQEARLKQDTIDRTNDLIASLSTHQKTEQERLEHLRSRLRLRQDRAKRIANLKRWLEPQRHMLAVSGIPSDEFKAKRRVGYADSEGAGFVIGEGQNQLPPEILPVTSHISSSASSGPSYLSTQLPLNFNQLPPTTAVALAHLPGISTLRQRLEAYIQDCMSLSERGRKLKEKDGQLEVMYRKVVSLCTKVEEERVDQVLEALVLALDSEGGLGDTEVGRVREFLRKVEGVEG